MEFAVKRTDVGVAGYLLAAIVFLIVPIPAFLLDIMLAFNISIALIVLMNCLFVKEVLDMANFPTVLLFTTIFRISLNVSSTRCLLRILPHRGKNRETRLKHLLSKIDVHPFRRTRA